MEPIEEDPAPTESAQPNTQFLRRRIPEELCDLFKEFMAPGLGRDKTVQYELTSLKRAPRTSIGRKTQPIPVIKTVWIVGVLLDADAEPMAIYLASDGTPYCTYFEPEDGTRRVEITTDFLASRTAPTLSNMLTVIKEKRDTLEALRPVEGTTPRAHSR